MSKVGGALPSWYWPAGIPRRVPVAQQPLGRILRQRFTAAGGKPALVSGDRTVSYAELSQRAIEIAGGLQSSSVKGALAVVDSDPAECLALLLGALFAGRPVFLPGGADDPAAAAQMVEAKVAALLSSADGAAYDGLLVLRSAELSGNFNDASAPRRANEPVILLAGHRGVVTHSHFSLSAMAASMAAFIPKLRETAFVCTAPSLGSWEMLTGILLALLGGMPVFFNRVEASSPPAPARAYVILDRAQANHIVAENRAPGLVRAASHVFVSTGSFGSRWRRKLESLCGAPVFPIWGVPELGPVLASHPTWLPPHGHGFPLVNVSLIPIDPATGRVSIVPWEMLERAEMGVEALSAMIGYAEPSRNAAAKSGTALRTRQIASMDHVGVVVLQDGGAGDAARA